MGKISTVTHSLKSGHEITIRCAVPDDAAALLAHGRAVVSEGTFVVTQPDEFNLSEDQEREWIEQHLRDPGRLLIVAEISRSIVGALFLECGERRRLAHRGMFHLAVLQQWRGRGIGTLLLQTLIEWATAHPTIEKLSLAVLATNTTAIGLYRKLGFVEEGQRPREIKLGPDEYLDDILMYRFV